MLTANNRQALRDVLKSWRKDRETVALVPTMGNLHEGHIALVDAAKHLADRVVTSIYVNPTQFGANEDLDQYPRTPEKDSKALLRNGCDLLFAPGVETIYPHGIDSRFLLKAPASLAGVLEGEHRPGHFDGVVTVVSRLFNLVEPDVAVFGEKDFQQLQVIRRMTQDLGYDIQIHGLATVREYSGLAMSSRNRYLDPVQKEAAGALFQVLSEMVRRIEQGDCRFEHLEERAFSRLEVLGFKVDYCSIRREIDLEIPGSNDRNLRVLAAVWCGKTRLLDNLKALGACNHSH